eukprot:TRINITY_DN27483_c0_g1_i1.p1 TRINITY_DN27483_c0_g1~~TRINITY_DN27483_c0_g1_i1.p1  ORF type:complete len:128 (-),score=27.79 TRINITY_DN27483_c0_g1_i1:36-419(-)
MQRGLVGSEMCIRDRRRVHGVKHNVLTLDIQPTTAGGVICFVCGDLYIDESPNPIKFSEVFNIVSNPAGGFYCLNDIFRLNLSQSSTPVSYTHLTLPTILLVQISVVAVSLKKKKKQEHTVPDHINS